MITAYTAAPRRWALRASRTCYRRPGRASERRWRDAEQDAGNPGARVGVAMRHARRVRHGVPRLEPVVLRADPQVQRALEDNDHLLVGVVGVGLVAGAAAGLDRRVDYLEAAVRAAGQELVHCAEALVHDLATIAHADNDAGALVGREELGDVRVERARDALHRCDRRRRDASLDLGQEALRDRSLGRELAQG